jgi:anti-sigma regulatory factor (Ser/Thr protein kinase)
MTSTETARIAAECPLPPLPISVQAARAFVRLTLSSWGLDVLVENAEVVASELATNAVKTTGELHRVPLQHGPYIGVRVLLLAKTVVLEVADDDPRPPVLQDVDENQENGRGLFIVTMLAECWDYYPSGNGKVVWAELAIPSEALAEAPLPRRLAATNLRGPRDVAALTDPGLLGRVRQGLLAL